MREGKQILRSSFFWKLYAGYVIMILLTTGIVGILVANRIEQDTLREIERSLQAQATLLQQIAAPALRDPEATSLQAQIRSAGHRIGARLTVIRADGTVIADSERKPSSMDNHADRPEIVAARKHGQGTATRLSSTVETRMMYLALPVFEGERLIGYVRSSLPLTVVHHRLGHLRSRVTLGTGIAALVALLLGFLVAHRVTAPLTSMTAVAESIAAGNYEQRVQAGTSDEFGQLASAFNRMAQQLSERMETITSDRNKLLAILASMVEGVVAVDTGERVLHMNEGAGKLLRSLPREAVGKRVWEVTRAHEVCQALVEVLGSESEVTRELSLTAGAKEQAIEIHGSPLRDGDGNLSGAVVVLADISDLRRLEGVRRDFVANVSHELKTPITAIRGIVETLLEDARIGAEERRRFLGKALEQSLRLSTLVSDLLTLSRLETGGDLSEHRPLKLHVVVSESARALQSVADEKGIDLRTDLPYRPVTVAGDEEALRQAVVNLLDNAVKYTPAGGKVWLRLKQEHGFASIEVQDTGPGIDPLHLDRIFERFYRIDKGRSRELGGTGLGLSIVKHVALAHGGSVSAESSPGQGSRFIMTLPITSV